MRKPSLAVRLRVCFFFAVSLSPSLLFAASFFPSADSTRVIMHPNRKQPRLFVSASELFGFPKMLESRKNRTDTLLLTSPYPERIFTVDDNKNYKQGRHLSFLVYPGEQLHMYKNEAGETYLRSDNAVRNNELDFFNALEKECGEFEGYMVGLLPINLDAQERKNLLEEKYLKRIDFLKRYRSSHAISENFKGYIESLFLSSYLTDLSFPFYSPYSSKLLAAPPLVDEVLSEKMVMNDAFFYESWYRSSVLCYVAMKSLKERPEQGITIEGVYETALKVLKGNTLDIALYDLLNINRSNADKGVNNRIIEKVLEVSENEIIRTHFETQLQPFYKTLAANDPGDQLTLLNHKFKIENLSETLGRLKGQYTYVDFWASWCAPCRAEMPDSKKIKAAFEDRGINFIYISTDENPSAWEKAMKQLGLTPEDNFILPHGNESAIAKKHNIQTIPRYILLDKSGKTLSDDAPRPSDSKLTRMLEELLKK